MGASMNDRSVATMKKESHANGIIRAWVEEVDGK